MVHMSSYITSLYALLLICVWPLSEVNAQDARSYLYGTVVTDSGKEFTGFLRWGKEELFWHDLFNSNKEQSDQYKVNKEKESTGLWSRFEWDLSSIWKNKYSSSTHLFSCMFGDIKTLRLFRGDRVDLEMKNGTVLHLSGGSNDIGATIRLEDYELGVMKFKWSHIDEIRFFEAPAGAQPGYGSPLYAQVETRRNGTFTGYIKWDLDERSGEDILDGESRYRDEEIPFKNITSIEKDGNGSLVTLRSGKALYLDDSNDVDDGNRGIRVYVEDIGNIEISWRQFERITFQDDPGKAPAYSDFVEPAGLMAEVDTYDDGIHTGIIVFDMDEMWEIETLDGNDNDLEYQIPFKNISRIVPKNSAYSMVYLHRGEPLLLGDSQDVNNRNDGLLLFKTGTKKPMTIKWKDIADISFKP